jgi:hypothetical protein
MSPALLTHRDRMIHGLLIEIERQQRFLCAEQGDRRAAAFHNAKIQELRDELEKLEERES